MIKKLIKFTSSLIPFRSLRQKYKDFLLYIVYSIQLNRLIEKNNLIMPQINTDQEIIDKILKERCSFSRFGDGEFELMFESGRNIVFQKFNNLLSKKLLEVFKSRKNNFLIGIPYSLVDTSKYVIASKLFWTRFFVNNFYKISNLLEKDKIYYDSLFSRPYITIKNKNGVNFEKIKTIFSNRDILIVEGSYTRFGVGNDLLKTSNSIRRILCPSKNAFEKYNEILLNIKHFATKNDLILLCLGPTATVLAFDLSNIGLQAIDIGHLDIEYEWFLNGSKNRTAIKNKSTVEADSELFKESFYDSKYINQIISVIEDDK